MIVPWMEVAVFVVVQESGPIAVVYDVELSPAMDAACPKNSVQKRPSVSYNRDLYGARDGAFEGKQEERRRTVHDERKG